MRKRSFLKINNVWQSDILKPAKNPKGANMPRDKNGKPVEVEGEEKSEKKSQSSILSDHHERLVKIEKHLGFEPKMENEDQGGKKGEPVEKKGKEEIRKRH
jgi:hypothetical protein